jgi:hypothetical protein
MNDPREHLPDFDARLQHAATLADSVRVHLELGEHCR